MYRASNWWPESRLLRAGTVDDPKLHETKLKPRIEQFCKSRVAWLNASAGTEQYTGNYLGGDTTKI